MALEPDMSQFGSQTLFPPAWPEVNEDILDAAAASYEKLALHLQGAVVPQLQQQLVALADSWGGTASEAAQAEATSIIGEHQANAEHASAIARQLRQMSALAVETKMAVNATAQEVEEACQAIEATPDDALVKLAAQRDLIGMGLAQNIATVEAGSLRVGGDVGVPAEAGPAGGSGGDPMQVMQMVMQMAPMLLSQLAQLPAQLSSLAGGGSASPLPQIPATFGQLASAAQQASPNIFSNHPLAGGSGLTRGAGLLHGMSLPRLPSLPGMGHGSAGAPKTSKASGQLMAVHSTAGTGGSPAGRLHSNPAGRPGSAAAAAPMAEAGRVGRTGAAPAIAPTAGAGAGGRPGAGSAPVGAGGTAAMGERGTTGGSRAATPIPARLGHDLTEGDADDDW